MSDDFHNSRRRPCHLLHRGGIPSVVWFEDALKAYGVPTAVFELYLLVPDIEAAAKVLEQNGWKLIPQEVGRIGNATLDLTLHPQLCLNPPTEDCLQDGHAIDAQSPKQSGPTSPSKYALPTVVLLPVTKWNVCFERNARPIAFVPSLEDLFDGLLDSMLDCPDLTLRDHLNVQLAYLYEYTQALKDRAFAERLLYEHRQYHFDVLSGMTYGTIPFVTHQRNIRNALREGTRELQECSATRDNEDLFNQAVQARLLASLPPPHDDN